MGLLQKIIRNFSGGLVTQADPQDASENSLAVLENFDVLANPGRLVGRPRFKEIQTVDADAEVAHDFGVYTVDQPSDQTIYVVLASKTSASPNEHKVWFHPAYTEATGWDTASWDSQQVLDDDTVTFDLMALVIRRGDARVFVVDENPDPPVFYGYHRGYYDPDWLIDNTGTYGYTAKEDYQTVTSPLPSIDTDADVTATRSDLTESHSDPSIGMPANKNFDFKFAVISYGEHGLGSEGFQIVTSNEPQCARLLFEIDDVTLQDRRVSDIYLYRSMADPVQPFGDYSLDHTASLEKGALHLGIPSFKWLNNTVSQGNDFNPTPSWTENDGTLMRWCFTEHGFNKNNHHLANNPGAPDASKVFNVRMGNSATEVWTEYRHWSGTDNEVVTIWPCGDFSGPTHIVTAIPDDNTIVVNGDMTAKADQKRGFIQLNDDAYTTLRIWVYEYNVSYPGETEIVIRPSGAATFFQVNDVVTFGNATQTAHSVPDYDGWVGKMDNKKAIVAHRFWEDTDLKATWYTDINHATRGAEIRITPQDTFSNVEWTTVIYNSYRHGGETLVWLWCDPAGPGLPEDRTKPVFDLRFFWQNPSGDKWTIPFWCWGDVSANSKLDQQSGMDGAVAGDEIAYGKYAALVNDRLHLADTYQDTSRQKDAALYSVYQSAGIANHLHDPLNLVVFGSGDSGKVKGFVEFMNRGWVFKDFSVWTIRIDLVNRDRILADRFPGGAGLVGEKSIVIGKRGLYHQAQDGFYLIDSQRSVRISDALRDDLLDITDADRALCRAAYDHTTGSVFFAIPTSTTELTIFIFEREQVWSKYIVDRVDATDDLLLGQHPDGRPLLCRSYSAATNILQLGASGTVTLPGAPTYKARTQHLLDELGHDSEVRCVYFRGKNFGGAGTLKLFTEGALKATITVASSADRQDQVYWLNGLGLTSAVGAYHELEFETQAPAPEIDHLGVGYVKARVPRSLSVDELTPFANTYSMLFDVASPERLTRTIQATDRLFLADWGSAWTVSIWHKVGTYTASRGLFSLGNNSDGWLIVYQDTGGRIRLKYNNSTGAYVAIGATAITADSLWHHYMMRFDLSDLYIYVDGAEDKKLSCTPGTWTWPTTKVFYLGAHQFNNNPKYHMDGSLDEFGIWSADLGASAAAALFNGRVATDLSADYPTNLEAFYRLGDGAEQGDGVKVYDCTANGQDFDFVGTPQFQADAP